MTASSDLHFMNLAYAEALKAVGNSDPNPAVGAVVVSPEGRIVSTGYTRRAGYAHAERSALEAVESDDLSACTLYVTLEPCCHFGRTPPCTDAILERKVRRVVIAERDHADEVRGKSLALLQEAGVNAEVLPSNLFAREKWFTTGPFMHSRRTGLPRVILKWAQTSDGSLAPHSGASGAISGEHAAFVTAALRSAFKFTLASPGTVRADAPKLTVRLGATVPAGISDTGLSPFLGQLLSWQPEVATELKNNAATTIAKAPGRGLMITDNDAATLERVRQVQATLDGPARILLVNLADFRSNFSEAFTSLLRQVLADGYNSVLVEAGPQFSEQILKHNLADALAIYSSRHNSDLNLWGKCGRGNSASRAVAAKDATPHIEGFELLERALWPQDDFFFFARTP